MSVKGKKYFPINTTTACQLKWAWSTVHLHLGTTASCHRITLHKFDIDSFNFHNTHQKIDQRKNMLDGIWPQTSDIEMISTATTTCEKYCGSIEKLNKGQSDRQFFLDIPNLAPPELDVNVRATLVSPTILEIYIDNVCNLSCIYCVPELSSRIDSEMKKYKKFSKNGLVLESTYTKSTEYDKIEKKFWEWMHNHAHKLKRLHLLGGEPFYQKQFNTFLDFFDNNPYPDLEFNIVTNLMLSKAKLVKYIDRFKELLEKRKIKRLDITASIDCWGPQQEFVRYGLNLNQWQENFEYLVSQKWIKLNINNTLSLLTIKTLPNLLELLSVWNKDRKIEHYFAKLYDPSYLDPGILGFDEFEDDFEKILTIMEIDTWRGSHAKLHMEGIVATIKNSVYNKEEALKLITYLDELDRRRNTNWRKLFPWLEKYENVV
jgi:organic radical activating enzyme